MHDERWFASVAFCFSAIFEEKAIKGYVVL